MLGLFYHVGKLWAVVVLGELRPLPSQLLLIRTVFEWLKPLVNEYAIVF